MYSILIRSESRFPVNRKRIKRQVEKLLTINGLTFDVEVSLAFVGERRMIKLNREYRDLDQAAAVLSFSQLEEKAGERFISSPPDTLYLGDIVICYPLAQKLANEENILIDEEIEALVEHGLLNLIKI
ncbi:MAG TPA: rRNA maturation RNase YbeY [Candidatus Bathyarchaeia archaeon]|nr:rRNA maturation RNase YbeY [Candidatus Bathyarchaeia archaeon]